MLLDGWAQALSGRKLRAALSAHVVRARYDAETPHGLEDLLHRRSTPTRRPRLATLRCCARSPVRPRSHAWQDAADERAGDVAQLAAVHGHALTRRVLDAVARRGRSVEDGREQRRDEEDEGGEELHVPA